MNNIQKQYLITLYTIFEQSITTFQNEIVLNFKKALFHATLRLCTNLFDEFTSSGPPRQKVLRRTIKNHPPK